MREFATLSGRASTSLPDVVTRRSGSTQRDGGRPTLGDVRSRPAGSPTCPDSLKTIRLWLAGLWDGRIVQEETGRKRVSFRCQSGWLGT